MTFNSRLVGDVGKRAVVIVPVKRIPQLAVGTKYGQGSSIHKIDVQIAVPIVVEKSAAGAHGFDEIFLPACRIRVLKMDVSFSGNVYKLNRTPRRRPNPV